MQVDEVIGNTTDPATTLHIQYCGGWGYRPRVTALEGALKDATICYKLQKDPGTTGNFEVNAFKGNSECPAGEGAMIYSKKASGKFPHDDLETFQGMLTDFCENWNYKSFWNQMIRFVNFDV